MSCVHYKYKNSLDYDTITFDGLHISLNDLRQAIMAQKKIGKSNDFVLQVVNAQTKEEYKGDGTLIPRNASVIVRRAPIGASIAEDQGGDNQAVCIIVAFARFLSVCCTRFRRSRPWSSVVDCPVLDIVWAPAGRRDHGIGLTGRRCWETPIKYKGSGGRDLGSFCTLFFLLTLVLLPPPRVILLVGGSLEIPFSFSCTVCCASSKITFRPLAISVTVVPLPCISIVGLVHLGFVFCSSTLLLDCLCRQISVCCTLMKTLE
eukprot:m.21008 g.21008  ORF g.21008 m.21008 type:complete len:261 (+) comp28121_c0_seq3:248-1030(+)